MGLLAHSSASSSTPRVIDSPTFTGVIKAASGAANAPSYTFTADPATGLYLGAAAQLAFAINGIRAAYIDSNGFWINAVPVNYSAPVTQTAATYTVALSDVYIIADRAGTVTLTLPAAATFTGRQLWVRTIQAQAVDSASANVVPRAGGVAGTAILGAVDGAWALLVSDGTNWQIMASS